MSRRIGIFGGSFNPVHIAHLILASTIRRECGLDSVWFMISPLNPFKTGDRSLIDDRRRLDMLKLAVDPAPGLEVCDIELSMPRPSYTVDTLRRISELYPDDRFSLIIGADNWNSFNRWRDPDEILSMVDRIYVYPRPGHEISAPMPPKATVVDTPLLEISSTAIRKLIAAGEEVNFVVTDTVYKYIVKHNLYR